ncbi:SusC/RagA family TonB-linked outer membrane protein [Odoribacter lunatus]|uniref:SusC/RagA family TonB-linked outer membrane protein n=1 Tax=Odoribacter lunatus TaxID=2941335 RepID=UPI003B96C5C2
MATDVNGKFALRVNDDDVLVFSFIGMKPLEVNVKGQTHLNVELESASEALDEVMVVAYGTAKKSSFTGSAAVVDSKTIEKRQVSNITNALSGSVAGVQVMTSANGGQPGSTAKIRVRGTGSLAAGNTPLYIVDGIPYDGDLSSINTADIESTTVLKDAASNALYGARGANGVVLITTKKGSIGKAVVNVDAKWGSNSRAVPKYDVLTSPATYLETAYLAMYNSQIDAGKSPEYANAYANRYMTTNSNGGVGYQIYTLPSGESLIGMDGKLNPNAVLGYSDGTYYYQPDDWYHELFDSGNLRQEYNVNISGASDKLNYYMSAGYLDDSGIIAGSGFTRYTGRIKVDYQVKDWLKIGTNMAYTNYDMQSPASQDSGAGSSSANLFYIANYIAPIYPMYARHADQSIMVDNNGFTVYDFGDGTVGGNFKRTWMSGSNPASMVGLDKRQYLADVLGGRWYATADIWKGLKFSYNLGIDLDNTRYSRLYNAYYGQYSKVGGIVYAGATRTRGINQQELLTYTKQFGHHNIDVLIGHENYEYQYKYLNGSKEKLFNPTTVEINNAIKNPSISSYTNNYSTEGWLARAQYDYDGKYIISASYRRDASSRFAKDNRWGNFGSLGGAWVLSKENFLANSRAVDFLKFKVSYGIQGNDNLLYSSGYVNYYPYQDQFDISENNGEFATSMSYKGNKDITWETSYSFNTGFDFNLFGNKLNGSVEYFNRKTTDMLYYMPVSVSNGYSEYPKNIGSMRNYGVEIDLNSDVVNNSNVRWNIYANATFMKNKLLELAPELDGELISGSTIYREGESIYQYYLRKYAGVDDQGQALYYVEDAAGNIETTPEWNKATRYATGDMLPTVYGGFGTTLSVYGIDFSVSCAYQLGGRVYDSGYASLMHNGSSSSAGQNWHKDILKAWSSTNTNSNIPQLNSTATYANASSDRFLISSNYLDLTNITLGYTLPKSWLSKMNISNLRIYFSADNVALWAKRKGLDPRQSHSSVNAMRYSPVRTISGGIKLTF